jgi:hypothetical protein
MNYSHATADEIGGLVRNLKKWGQLSWKKDQNKMYNIIYYIAISYVNNDTYVS